MKANNYIRSGCKYVYQLKLAPGILLNMGYFEANKVIDNDPDVVARFKIIWHYQKK